MSKIRIAGLVVCLLLIVVDIVPLTYAVSRFARYSSGKVSRCGLVLMEKPGSPASDAAIQQTISIIRARLDALGIDSPVVEQSPIEGETIQILLPPMQDKERALNLINASSEIQLRPVAQSTQFSYPTQAAAESAIREIAGGPDQYEAEPYHERGGEQGWLVLEKASLVISREIRDASAEKAVSGYTIYFSTTPEAAVRLADWTGRHIGDHLAIVLNNEVKSAPTVQSQIYDRVQITGSFTQRQAEDLALILRSGALPCKAVYVRDEAATSTHWTRKYGMLAGGCALVLIILIGLSFLLALARRPRQSGSNHLQDNWGANPLA